MNNDILIIKSKICLKVEALYQLQQNFAKQLKSGVVIIPEFFDCEVIQCPTDVKIIYEPLEDGELNDQQ